MRSRGAVYAGIDVGGRRKGFHLALINGRRLAGIPLRLATPEAVVDHLVGQRPALVAIDSPDAPAPAGEQSRPGERALARAVCNIRWTPDSKQLKAREYYAWILNGLALYHALQDAGIQTKECFPTASFTRWIGPRRESRSAWTRDGLRRLGLEGLALRSSQDDRDAIAAAVTAWQCAHGQTESFGDIVVPRMLPDWRLA